MNTLPLRNQIFNLTIDVKELLDEVSKVASNGMISALYKAQVESNLKHAIRSMDAAVQDLKYFENSLEKTDA